MNNKNKRYQPNNVEQSNSQETGSRKTRLILIGICVLILVLVIILVPIFVVRAKRAKTTTTPPPSPPSTTTTKARTTTTTTTTITTTTTKASCSKTIKLNQYSRNNTIFDSMIIADVNEDNIQDVIIGVTQFEKHHIKIFFNFYNGNLTAENIYPVDIRIRQMRSGDMNNDGKLDIICIDDIHGDVYILYNTGNGTFFNKLLIRIPGLLNDIEVVHMNEDDRLDIIFIYDNIMILYNMGNEEFLNQTYEIDEDPTQFEVIDMNNDNKFDLIIMHRFGNISLFLNNGNRTFLRSIVYSIEFEVKKFLTINIDNDDKLDFIFVGLDSKISQNFLITDNGRFDDRLIYSFNFTIDTIEIGDINNDQKTDLIIGSYGKNINILVQMDDETFYTKVSGLINLVPLFVKPIDINGDGYMEIIIVAHSDNNYVSAYYQIYC